MNSIAVFVKLLVRK